MRKQLIGLFQACLASWNRPVRNRMPWWCGEGARQRASLPDLRPFVAGLYGVGRFPTTLIYQVDMALTQQLLQALRARLGNVCVRKVE